MMIGCRSVSRVGLFAGVVLQLVGCAESAPRPEEGAALYLQYCASCHGKSGRGDGPVAETLRPAPSDLTRFAARNDGRFDGSKVLSTIDGRYQVAAHGPRDMPVWGTLFMKEHADDPMPMHRGMDDARALVDYLRTLQVDDATVPAAPNP